MLDLAQSLDGDPDGVAFLLGAVLDADADAAARTLIDRDPAANIEVGNGTDIGILLDELNHAEAHEQIELLITRDDARTVEQPADPALRAEPDPDELSEEIDRTDPADVAFWLEYLIDEEVPDPVTTLLGPDLPSYLILGYPDSVLGLLRVLVRAGAGRHIQTLAMRAAGDADLITNPELSGRVLSILREAGATEHADQLIGHDPAGRAELVDPRGVARLLDALREAGADEQVAALLARDPAEHVVLGNGGGSSLVWALYRAGAQAQAESLNALLPDAGEFSEFCSFEYGDEPGHAYRYGREPNGSPARPWGWADLS